MTCNCTLKMCEQHYYLLQSLVLGLLSFADKDHTVGTFQFIDNRQLVQFWILHFSMHLCAQTHLHERSIEHGDLSTSKKTVKAMNGQLLSRVLFQMWLQGFQKKIPRGFPARKIALYDLPMFKCWMFNVIPLHNHNHFHKGNGFI